MVDYQPYIIEQKVGNDFLRDLSFTQKRERQIVENHHFILVENDFEDFIKQKKSSTTKELTYNFDDSFFLKIPFELKYIESAYIKSEYILKLEDDWDDNGSSKYDIKTWKKALVFFNEYSKSLFSNFNKKIENPKIYHGPKGSIDILLENNNYSLLINVLKDQDKAVYFGKDNLGNISKGEINLMKINIALAPIAFNF